MMLLSMTIDLVIFFDPSESHDKRTACDVHIDGRTVRRDIQGQTYGSSIVVLLTALQ